MKQFLPQADTREFDLSEGLPFPDSVSIVIIADLSLHYISDEVTSKIIKDIHRVLKLNGILLQIHYYFDETIWGFLNIQEYEINRYSKPKTLWEIAITRKA